jgi:putative peptide maturation dehydrogenase
MHIRRCATLLIEPRETIGFDLGALLGGETGVRTTLGWVALAGHVDDEIPLDAAEVALLGELSPNAWIPFEDLAKKHPREALDALLAKGLIVAQDSEDDHLREHARRDEALRATHWRDLAAVMHRHTRWKDVDTEEAERRFSEASEQTFLERLGPSPPPVHERVSSGQRIALQRPHASALEELSDRRVTCRNYDPSRAVSQEDFSALMYRTFGARVVSDYAPGVQLLKKGVPSAGGLHATEAYVLVQNVDGVAPGLYHYHPVAHALEPLRALQPDAATALAKRFVAAQAYYAQAHVMIALVSRFPRNFWKYRNHAKAYRAVTLDAGHLSQMLYLTATELNLGAFITAAVNEAEIEQAFGLEPMEEGPLAVCGFGVRASEKVTVEFDPAGKVWPAPRS